MATPQPASKTPGADAFSSARHPFHSLLLLGSLTLVGLFGLLAWQAPIVARGAWLACRDALSALMGYLPALGLALPLLLLGAGLLRGGWSLLSQTWHTHRLIGQLNERRQPLPHKLAVLAQQLDVAGRLVLVDDDKPYAFTQGLRRPRIWLSSGLLRLLDDAELLAVLRHERYHILQYDPLRVLLSRIMAQALFFLPLADVLCDDFLVAKEVDADVASEADEWLATALLKLLRAGSSLTTEATLAAIGPFNATAARIDRLLQRERPALRRVRSGQLWISLLLVLLLIVISYTSMVQAASPLQGEECGYTTWIENGPYHELQASSNEYTPATLVIKQ